MEADGRGWVVGRFCWALLSREWLNAHAHRGWQVSEWLRLFGGACRSCVATMVLLYFRLALAAVGGRLGQGPGGAAR